jgi:hypothetical protein
MRVGMTQLDAQVTARPERSTAMQLRAVFPFRWVVLPWIVARLLVVPTLIFRSPPDNGTHPLYLLAMDGGWFRLIALDWYDRHDGVGGINEYPFFPLFPAAGGLLMRAGVPSIVALAGLSWVGALLAMAGAKLLAERHVSVGASRLTPWVIALAPGGLSLILAYSDAFYLAALIWAMLAVEDRRWWAAGLLAAVATASRPNGAIAVVAIVIVALGLRAGWRQIAALVVPSVVFILGWMLYLRQTTGDALLFWTAKGQWVEESLFEFLADPLHQRLVIFHVVVLVVYAVPYLMRVRTQPPAWLAVAVLGVLPAVFTGLVGVARYAILAFPVSIAAADVLANRSRPVIVGTLAVSALSLMALAKLVVEWGWVP